MGQPLFQSISSLKTDPSRNGNLHSIDSTGEILIQGPSGTSRCQSLNVSLVNALKNHKKTMVVCEKRTSLEVLHGTLNDLGLSDHCVLINDIELDRDRIVNSVRNRIDNSISKGYEYSHTIESKNNFISRCKSLVGSICNQHDKLDDKSIKNINWSHIVGQLLTELGDTEEEIQLALDRAFEFDSEELAELLEVVQKGQILFNEYKPYEELAFINSKKNTGNNTSTVEQGINDDFQHYSTEIEDLKALEEKFKDQYFKIRKEELNHQIKTWEEIHKAIKQVIGEHRKSLEFLDEEKTKGLLYKLLSVFSGERKRVLKGQELIRTLFADLGNHLNSSKDLHKFAFNASIEINCWRLIDLRKWMEKIKSSFDETIAYEYQNLNLLDLNIAEYHTKTLDNIKDKGFGLGEKINSDEWLKLKVEVTNYNTFITDIERIIKSKTEYFKNNRETLNLEFRWFQFYNGLSIANRSLIDKLKLIKDWSKVFLIYYLNALLIKLDSTYRPSNDNEHGELKESSSKLGNNQIRYINEYWYAKQMSLKTQFDAKNNLSIKNLYNKRGSQINKRLSLSKIIKINPVLFNTFFPIVLTTPDVYSHLFKGMNKHFDIVLYDEASQIHLKENFPTLLKPRNSSLGVFNEVNRYLDDGYLSKIELDVFKLHLFPKSGTDFHTLDQMAVGNNLSEKRIEQIRSGVKRRLQDLILDLWKTSKHEQLYFNEQMFILSNKDVSKINNTEKVNFDISFVNFLLSVVCVPGYYFQEINLNAPNYTGFFISPIPGFNLKEFFKDILSVKDDGRNNDISFTLENLMSGYFDAESQYIPNIHKPKIVSALQLLASIVNNEKNKIEVNEWEMKFVKTNQ